MKTLLLLVSTLFFVGSCAEPFAIMPGGKLEGQVTTKPAEWNGVPDTIQVETNPEDPYSINIWGVGIGPDLYIATGEDGTRWSAFIEQNPKVRVRINGNLHELTASKVTDDTERAMVLEAYIRKYEVDPEGSFVETGMIFRFD